MLTYAAKAYLASYKTFYSTYIIYVKSYPHDTVVKMSDAPVFIDVREPEEFAGGHVAGAVNVPLSTLMDGAAELPFSKDAKLVLYCRTGNRSGIAAKILHHQGYMNAVNGINQTEVEAQYPKNE